MNRFEIAFCPDVGRKTHLALLLTVIGCGAAGSTGAQTPAPLSSESLGEIVVTAEKRESTVQKTPISITAISGAELTAQGTTSVLGVAQETPGVSFRTAGPGETEFEIRGLSSSGGATATVGYYLDDIPVSPPALGSIGKVAIDPNLYDLSRVEVLRGPQGTLYGAGSMGGTIKVITNPAKLDTWEAAADTGLSSTASNGGTNYNVNALTNVPLINGVAAMRVVVSTVYTDGWIDRIVLNPFPLPTNNGCAATIYLGCARGDVASAAISKVIPRSNSSQLDTARVNFLIQPSDALRITASAMYQRTRSAGYSQFDSPPGPDAPLAHYQAYDDPEPTTDNVRLVGLTGTYDFAAAQLTSATSYWNRFLSQYQEDSESFVELYGIPTFYDHDGTAETDSLKQVSQELRLASTGTDPFQWLVGGFYSDLKTQWDQTSISPGLSNAIYNTGAYLPVTAADNPNGIVYLGRVPYTMKQYAFFSDLSYQLSSSLKLSAGGRYYNYDSTVNAYQSGIFTQSVSAVPTMVNSDQKSDGVNPNVNLSYTPNDDLTVYGTVAKGFRPGGSNLPLPQAGPNSCAASLTGLGQSAQTNTYRPDSVWSYEVGEKARLDDGRITINSAIYYIRWKDIQQLVPLACGYFFTLNAGDARSYGSEVEVHANLSSDWSVNGSGAYTNATINDPTPGIGIASGTPLLNIPKYTASAALMYAHPLTDTLRLTGRVGATYTGSILDEAYTYVRLPSYALVDARIGVLTDKYTAYLYATNLTNKVAELTANNTALTFNVPDYTRFSTNQPRTVGFNISAKF